MRKWTKFLFADSVRILHESFKAYVQHLLGIAHVQNFESQDGGPAGRCSCSDFEATFAEYFGVAGRFWQFRFHLSLSHQKVHVKPCSFIGMVCIFAFNLLLQNMKGNFDQIQCMTDGFACPEQ